MVEFERVPDDAVPEEPPPDCRSPLGWHGYGACTFCGSADTVWQHDLKASRRGYRTMFGKGRLWAGAQLLCERCEGLYDRGDYGPLSRLHGGGASGVRRRACR